jgi:aminopeptidase N
MGIQSVIAHEYFHNWTGNRNTCRDWFQLTLKEGLTVFRDQCFSADLNSEEVQRIEDVKGLRERQFVEDASPTRHPIQPKSYISMNNFYTSTVYEKGAEVIRMIHTLLGEKNYRKATDLYFESFDGQAVTTDDFLWAMSKASGVDLEAFKLWYHQSGTPHLEVEKELKAGVYTIKLKQVVPTTLNGSKQKPFFYPLKMALLDENGEEIINETLIIKEETHEFSYEVKASKVELSLNRDFSSPIIINQKSDNAFLMKHDTNSFIKYEASQTFAIDTIEALMRGEEIDESYLDTFGLLLSLKGDLSYKALLLELPSVSTLMQRQDEVDFEPIYEAKEKLALAIAKRYKDELLEIYHTNHSNSAEIDSLSMSKRSIKNRVIRILSSLESDEILSLVAFQYNDSLNMTDKVVALDILENCDARLAQIAMKDFYNKYKDQTLVMNKYFSILAASHREGTLDRVMALQNDEVYDEKVPNLVRSLIGVFARNYKHFHAKDGHGYSFVADKIIEIDKINPQMASGLAGAFKIYNRINTTNKVMIQKELKRVVSTQGLSKNSMEIIEKILK